MAASASDIPTARTVTGGTLTWAVSDVLSQPGDGSAADKAKIEVAGGAARLSDGAVRFTAEGGAFDPATGRAVVTYTGSVTLTVAHRTVSVAAPRILVDGERSVLQATVAAAASGARTLEPTGTSDAVTDVARLGPPRPQVGSRSVSWTGMTATLTEEAAKALVPLVTSGSLKPVSLDITVSEHADPAAQRELALALAAESPTPSASASSSGSPSASPSTSPSTSPCPSPSASSSATPSSSTTPSESATPSTSPSESATPSTSPSSSATPSTSPSESATPSTSPSESATPSTTPSSSATPSTTPSESPSATPSESPCASPSASPSESPSETPTDGGPSTTYTTVAASGSNTLAKTGDDSIVPLTMAGVALIVGGVFTLRIARRGGYVADDF
ncbi:HtaA domain-containing protein [Planotetraspora phitsanulokensis]